MYKKLRQAVAYTLCGILLIHAVPGLAQSPAASGDETRYLETILVTAQKREQNILDVPISVLAVDGEAFADRGFAEINELQFMVPGLIFTQGNTTRVSNNSIRGIGTATFSDSIEGSVGIVIDGVVVGRAGAGLFDLADIERVEVLRGPQGTLFGKNASAGLINIVTKRPAAEEFEYKASASYASMDELRFSGTLSGPLTDAVGARLTGYMNQRDGQVDDVLSGEDYNQRDEWGLRGKLEFELSENSDLLLIGDYSERDVLCCTWTTREWSDGRPGSGLFGSGVSVIGGFQQGVGIEASPDNDKVALSGSMRSEGESWGVSAEYGVDFGSFALTSITAYREWEQRDNNDADQTTFNILDENLGDARQDQFTQELRLTSIGDSDWTWTLGAFYFEQSVRTDSFQSGSFGLDLLGALPPGTILGRTLSVRPDTRNYALFGDVSYAVSERTRLLAGARVQREELDVDFTRFALNATTPAVLGPAWGDFEDDISVSDDAVTWRVGIQHDLSGEAMVYATVTEGYKGPGVNTNVDTVGLAEVDPEVPLSFEIGSKSLLLDGRMSLNAAVFYTSFDDFQAESLVVSAGGGPASFDITNAGELETYGLELELSAVLAEGWDFMAGLSWMEATYEDFEGAACYVFQTEAQGCIDGVQDLSGADLINAPDYTFNMTTSYEFPIGAGGINGFVSGSYYYRSDVVTAQDQDPNAEVDGYGMVDASLGLRDGGGRWSLSLFARNLFEEDFVESVFDTPFDNGGYSQFLTPASERFIGVRITAGNQP